MKYRTVLVVLLFLASGAPGAPQTQKSAAVKDPAVIDAQGFAKLLQENRGRPLVVNFWATWCEPCRSEYPLLNDLAKQYAPQGLRVIGVSLDDEGEMILVRRFLARHKPVFRNYRKKHGGEAEFVQAVFPGWNGAIPATFFYARDGRQVGHLLGEGHRDTFEAAIRTVLSAGAPPASPGR